MRVSTLGALRYRSAIMAVLSISFVPKAMASGKPDIAWFGRGGNAWSLAMSPDGRTFVTSGAFEHALKMWHTDGTFVRTFAEGFTPFWSVAFSPDGKTLVAGREGVAGATEATALIYRTCDGSLVRGLNTGFQNNLYVVHGVDYSPSGDLVAVAYDNYSEGIKLYNATTGALVRSLPEGGYDAKFSPDGQSIEAARVGGPRLWRVSDGEIAHVPARGTSVLVLGRWPVPCGWKRVNRVGGPDLSNDRWRA